MLTAIEVHPKSRTVACVDTVDRGHGRQSRIIQVGKYVDGPWLIKVTVMPHSEVERIPHPRAGVEVRIEWLHARREYTPARRPEIVTWPLV